MSNRDSFEVMLDKFPRGTKIVGGLILATLGVIVSIGMLLTGRR